ncbi:LysR family transcriptional regulator [Perlucidibaca aquatica]|uniref:LysR family transcriptional regulator n=1 Tax=Perlucidibaca aquatica TaxID=1852776 RepID=UPI00083B8097|nr:LysR family transcriptional regulator [Perlucidibaca aquatica]
MDIRQLRTLKAIHDTGSLVAAAERLHLTQSALSHQLRELEAEVDAVVLIRKTRPPRFTQIGERLLALADTVLPALREAERDIIKLRGGQAGRLIMAIECHSCYEWLMPTLNIFRQHWPEVEIDFQSGFHGDAQDDLQNSRLDWVVTSNPSQVAGISYQPLFQYESLLVLSNDHALNQKREIAPEDLAEETLITYPVDSDRLDIFQHFLTPAGVMPAKLRSTELTLMMVQLVASGRGVAALPSWAAAEYVARGWVKTRALGHEPVWCTLYAAIREEDVTLPYMQDLLATIRDSSQQFLSGVRPAP